MIARTDWAPEVVKLKAQIEDLVAPLKRVQIGEVGLGVTRLIANSLDEEVELLDPERIEALLTDPARRQEAERWINLAKEHIATLVALNGAISYAAA